MMANQDQAQTTTAKLNEPARGAENFLRWSSFAMLRGGRVTKFKGVAASYSPELGLVSSEAGRDRVADGGSATLTLGLARRLLRWSVAPVALLAGASPAFAQAEDLCIEVDTGEFVCEDNGDPATQTQVLGGFDDDPAIVDIEDGFDIDTTGTGTAGMQIVNAEGITVNLEQDGISTIIGDTDGVRLDNEDDGAIVATFGNVTGINGDGIYAINSASRVDGSLILDTTAGSVTGGENGINVRNLQLGDTSITTADVTGQTEDGIRVQNETGTGDLTIDSTGGAVVGGSDGIDARNDGSGAVSITTGDVSGNGYDGIFTTNRGTDLTIDSSAGDVFGDRDGIDARNYGSGTLSITTGDVTADRFDGINARNEGTDFLIDTTAGAILGAADGIEARNDGSGVVSVVTGDVTGTNRDGIRVINNGTDLTVDSSAGNVTGGSDGIEARNFGSGAVSVTTANVTGSGYDGIFVTNNGTDLTVDSSAGAVTGDRDGIDVRNYGSGVTSVTTADVTGESGSGIFAQNNGSATDLIVDSSAGSVTASVSSYSDAIRVRNNGTGITRIVTADVTSGDGSGEGGNGIDVFSGINTTGLEIDTSAGTVTGDSTGIRARNYGTGNASVVTADVIAGFGDGINVRDDGEIGNGVDMLIDSSAGSVTGTEDGIDAFNFDTGDLTIVTGDVTAQSGRGIAAINQGPGTGDLTIDSSAGTVSSASRGGIEVLNTGFGETRVTTADVSGYGEGGSGILVQATGSDVFVDSSAGRVSSGYDGGAAIDVLNQGTGSTTIITGDVFADTADGIRANNVGTDAGDLTIDTSAGSVTSGDQGIYARNVSDGDTAITTADITGESGDGVYVYSSGSNGSVSVDTSGGTVSAGGFGIQLYQFGSGATSITTADVIAGSGDGVYSYTSSSSGDTIIDTSAGTVTGADDGVEAYHYGDGILSITTANVVGQADDGIRARSSYADIVINSSAGSVSGAQNGIYASQYGEGSIAITTADVAGANGDGIRVRNDSSSNGISVDSSAGAVTGGGDGIDVINSGYYSSTSVITGDVTGQTGAGITVRDDGEAGYGAADIAIDSSAGSVSGATVGISASNRGVGDLSITTADVTGASDNGISATNTGGTGSLTINSVAGAVTGADRGIDVSNGGYGDTTITTGDVNGAGSEGIFAVNEESAGDLLIDTTAGSVSGDDEGIEAINRATGATTIITGDVTTASGFGISIDHYGTDLLIDTTAGTIFGGSEGIDAENEGTGSLTVITGDVSGGDDEGIQAFNYGTSLSIDSSLGTVTGQGGGIYARSGRYYDDNAGVEALSIFTGDVTGYGEDGVQARNYGTDLIIDTSAGTVSSERAESGSAGTIFTGYGIIAENSGSGSLSITSADVSSVSIDAIFAENDGTDLIIDSSAGSVSGQRNGIRGVNNGSGSTFVSAANVTGSNGDGVNMITGADSTTLDIDTSDGAVVGGDRGIFADHGGSDDLTITVGNVTGQGAEGILALTTQVGADVFVMGGEGVDSNVIGATTGIALTTQGADITVTGLDSVTGQNGDGLNLVSNGGNIFVSDIGTIAGLGGNGIFAISDNGNITIENVGLVGGITATGGVGIAAYADNGGTVTIGTSGDVTGETYGVNGSAGGGLGDITIDTTNYAVNAAIGIRAVNLGDGDTSVTTADVTGTAGEGILASTDGGSVEVNSVAGTVSGLTNGITTINNGSGGISITTADVTGTTGDGISAVWNSFSEDGTSIDSTAGTVTGGQNGIRAQHVGYSTLSIVTADVSGATADGINAYSYAGDIVIDSSAGEVSGGDGGVYVRSQSTGSTSITTANVNGNGDDGVSAYTNGESLTIDTTAGDVFGADRGIDALSFDDQLSITTGDVTGRDRDGIGVYAAAETIEINTTAGTVSGGTRGISLINAGTGDALVVTGDVTGLTNDGIRVSDYSESGVDGGDILIDASAGTVTGGANGIVANNTSFGDLAITTADVVGTGDDGINARNDDGTGSLTIDSTAGTVSGGVSGIVARHAGSDQLTIITGDVQGADDLGISASSTASAISIDSSAGTVQGAVAGIFADQQSDAGLQIFVNEVTGQTGIEAQATTGATEITLASTALVIGTDGAAIDASSAGGSITIQGSSGMISGQTAGVFARSAGGEIAVDEIDLVQSETGNALDLASAGGNISVTAIDRIIGAAGNGILAEAGGGNIEVSGNGDIAGALSGIVAQTSGAGQINVNVTGATNGGDHGIELSSEGGAASISNSGTLSGGAFAVFASGGQTGPISLLNTGTVGTAIGFAAADDRFDNDGLFMADGASDFGEGFDALFNSDTLSVAASAEFLRLEQFTNSGLITLANGAAGGSLSTAGDFVGDGGTLALDVDFAAGAADVFTVGGAASGVTQLVLNPIALNATFAQDIVVVDAGAGTEAGAFVISDEAQTISEFLAFELAFDAATNDFLFGLALEPRAFEANKLAEGAQSLWYRTSDVWSDHRANARFASDDEAPVWAVVYGAESSRDEAFADPTGFATGDAVLDYSQDFFGFQAGVETSANEVLTLGVTGGYLTSNLRFDNSGARALFDTLNIGASLSLQSGGFFADGLIKYDAISGDLSDTAAGGFNGDLDGSAFGGRLELGYRTQGSGLYAEPKLSLEYQKTDLDDLNIAGQRFEFDQLDGLRGIAGVRVGGTSGVGEKTTVGFYLEGSAVHEFEGEGLTRFSSASDDLAFGNNPIDTYARVEAGVTIEGEGPISGFFKAESDISSDFTSFGGSAGIRIRF